jgi:hypothetical protein
MDELAQFILIGHSERKEEFSKRICEAALVHYAVTTEDIRKCPSKGCQGFGVIDAKACSEPLRCELCNATWKDPIHNRKQEYIRDFWSNLRYLLISEPCPNCGVYISKSGGCKHMTCGKCNY